VTSTSLIVAVLAGAGAFEALGGTLSGFHLRHCFVSCFKDFFQPAGQMPFGHNQSL
jgi:hypothetical protein